MDIGFDQNVHATNTIQVHLLIFVLPPVTEFHQVCAAGIVLLVALGEDGVFWKRFGQPAALV